ncbi:SDR family NAD(P)-dependent oxidoreductase [Labedella populi]|uniref:SDR family NAD(P)-dependent oxidoreductase n=1 Tax=Labedella populi TaxID=2498850 RepID=A0A444Q691_9MICO|nr:SDR family NAD(P)-dependent oxidoreductase [Labedella populi]RWZ59302.1 SDR family NAD(P)-dependent oxidoreductase [Labedella populi]
MTTLPARAPGTTLIAGCGKLGTALGHRIIAAGGRVVALRRDVSGVPPTFSSIAADLSEPSATPLPHADSLVVTLTPSAVNGGYRTALSGLTAALPTRPTRTVFVSSTGVFESWRGPQPITESGEPTGETERARMLIDGESAAVDILGAIILRPAGIYGPGRDFLIRQTLTAPSVDGGRMTNRIHEADLARALEVLLTMEAPPRVLHAVDEEPAALRAVVDHIASRLGVTAPPTAESNEPSGNAFDGTALRSVLGHLEYPDYRVGYDELVAAHGRQD